MNKKPGHHYLIVFLLISFLILSSLQLIPFHGGSEFQNKFSNGETKVTVTFDSGGIDADSLAIEVPLDASILSASLKVTPMKHNGKYPTDITVNVGNDQDNEWEFKGPGYGAMGKQTLLSTGEDRKYLYFQNVNTLTTDFMIPKNSTITKTAMT